MPITIGIEKVLIESPVIIAGAVGEKYPISLSVAIAVKNQIVRKRSRKRDAFLMF